MCCRLKGRERSRVRAAEVTGRGRGRGQTLTRNLSVKVFIAVVNVGEPPRAQVQNHAAFAEVRVVDAQGSAAFAGMNSKLVQYIGDVSVSAIKGDEKRGHGGCECDAGEGHYASNGVSAWSRSSVTWNGWLEATAGVMCE